MKYSIVGNTLTNNAVEIVDMLNNYTLWKLNTGIKIDRPIRKEYFIFEVWLNSIDDKTNLFNELKSFVNENNEVISWHECTHDEEIPRPCIIAEEYRGD